MTNSADKLIDNTAHAELILSFETDYLLKPISAANPCGDDLSEDPIFDELEHARAFDDPTLPLGPWERELKQADWPLVVHQCSEILVNRSKDMRVLIWITEALTYLYHWHGLLAGLNLLTRTTRNYWTCIHPREEDTFAHRANLLEWLGNRFIRTLNQIPILSTGQARQDWMIAARNESLVQQKDFQEQVVGATYDELNTAVTTESTDHLSQQHGLFLALHKECSLLSAEADRLMGDQAPSLIDLTDLIDDIYEMLGTELQKRGITDAPEDTAREQPVEETNSRPRKRIPDSAQTAMPPLQSGLPLTSREAAYAELQHIADYLIRIDPHSPGPHLLQKALEWSRYSAAQLYDDIFIQGRGQIDIFELLGLRVEAGPDEQDDSHE